MSRKRSKYRPRGVQLDTMAWVMSGIRPFTKVSEGTILRIKNHDALEKMRLGLAKKADLDIVIGAFNVMEGLLRLGYGLDYFQGINAAQDALLAVARRGVNNGRFIMTGPEMKAINLGMEIHDAQLDACTVQDLEKAMEIVTDCVVHKRARSIIERHENGEV